ncbi:hypothetical protein PWT90_03091 [Aphanocladium album]|nr:hypothetical protein PWT90_03091 [Aphanocladium album]
MRMETSPSMASLANLPTEIHFSIGEKLRRVKDVGSLLLANDRLSCVFIRKLHELDAKQTMSHGGSLAWGVCHDELSVVKRALEAGANIDTIFFTATRACDNLNDIVPCEGSDVCIRWYATQHGSNMALHHSCYRTPRTPLLDAIMHGNVAMTKYLVEAGADVNLEEILGVSPITMAIRKTNLDIVRLLMETGRLNLAAGHNSKDSIAGLTASIRSSVLVQYILTTDANYGPQASTKGIDALFQAIEARDHEMVAMLLACPQVDPSRDVAGGIGLLVACHGSDWRMVKVLLRDGKVRAKMDMEKYAELIRMANYKGVVKLFCAAFAASCILKLSAVVQTATPHSHLRAAFSPFLLQLLLQIPIFENYCKVMIKIEHTDTRGTPMKKPSNPASGMPLNTLPDYAARMQINKLPDYLLVQIGGWLRCRGDLRAMVMTSKRFHALFEEKLYTLDTTTFVTSRSLWWAARECDFVVADKVIKFGCNIDASCDILKPSFHRITAVVAALRRKHPAMVALLVTAGANVDTAPNREHIPVFMALENKWLDTLKLLCSVGNANLDVMDNYGHGILTAAARQNDLKAVRYLLSISSRLGAKDAETSTPFHQAIHHHNVEMIALLLKSQSISPETPDAAGMTPLQLACEHNRVLIARLLLDDGRAVAIPTETNGRSLLVQALQKCKFNLAMLLLTHKNPYPSSAMAFTEACKAQKELIAWKALEMLDPTEQQAVEWRNCAHRHGLSNLPAKAIRAGADPNAMLDHILLNIQLPRRLISLSVMGLAVCTKNVAMVRYLIEHGADVRKAGNGTTSPILLALFTRSTEMVRLLVEAGGVERDSYGLMGESILAAVARHNDLGTVQYLLSVFDIDPCRFSTHGCLHYAIDFAEAEIAKCLLASRHVDPNELAAGPHTEGAEATAFLVALCNTALTGNAPSPRCCSQRARMSIRSSRWTRRQSDMRLR